MANETETIIDILEAFGEKLLVDTRKSIDSHGHSRVGNAGTQTGMLGSDPYQVYEKGGVISFEFRLADYADYVDGGTRPATKSGGGGIGMAKSLQSWIVGKPGLKQVVNTLQKQYTVKDKNGNKRTVIRRKTLRYDKAEKQLSWMIKKNIHKKGIIKRFNYKGSKFFSSLLEDGRIEELQKQLTEAMGKSIALEIKNGIIKGIA